MKIVSRDRWFEVQHRHDGICLIHEPYVRPFYRCNMWHVQGRVHDVLIDSGSGLVSLREQLPWLTEKPLMAVASHCHFDHIAGHHEFSERLVHPAEADILAAPDGANTLATDFVGDEMFEAHPDCPLCYAEYLSLIHICSFPLSHGQILAHRGFLFEMSVGHTHET